MFYHHIGDMRQLFITILVAVVSTMTAMAETPGGQLPEAAMKTIRNCIWLIDNDMPQSAMEDLDLLAKEYPDNYVIQYERACALYRLGRYDDVVKISKRLIKHRNVTPIAFHIYGNALDNLGKTDQAINVYSKGLKRFPDAGMLYLELGVVALKQEHYNEAINKFECGIAISSIIHLQLLPGGRDAAVIGCESMGTRLCRDIHTAGIAQYGTPS